MLQSRQIPEILYNIAMKIVLKLFTVLFLLLFTVQASKAEDYKILVLPDNIQFDSTNYYIYPDTSIMFASDVINEIKKSGKVQTVSMTEIRDALRKNTRLNLLTRRALKEFKYNYNIPFVDFKAIADCFSTNKVLVITSQTDVQNFFLRRTVWDFLNVPGTTVIDPAYKLSTYAALIDVDKEQVLWQNTYYRTISSMENRMVAQNFAPATEQLKKIKSYSSYVFSPQVAMIVQSKILPPSILNPDNNIVEVTNKQDVETLPQPVIEELDLKQKNFVKARPSSRPNGEIVNDL